MFAAGGILWVNIKAESVVIGDIWEDNDHSYIIAQAYGWPVKIGSFQNLTKSKVHPRLEARYDMNDPVLQGMRVLADAAVGLILLLIVAALAEYWIYYRSLKVKSS